MKKLLIIISLCSIGISCSNNKSDQSANNNSQNASNDGTKVAETDTASATGNTSSKGAELIASSDCLACHQEQSKLVGPAYTDVAKKYTSNDKNIDYLAKKIISGGNGVWGDITMAPHQNLALDDAKEIARYILSLK